MSGPPDYAYEGQIKISQNLGVGVGMVFDDFRLLDVRMVIWPLFCGLRCRDDDLAWVKAPKTLFFSLPAQARPVLELTPSNYVNCKVKKYRLNYWNGICTILHPRPAASSLQPSALQQRTSPALGQAATA